MATQEYEALPTATETDRRAVRVFLRARQAGESRTHAETYLNLLARWLGCEDCLTCPWSALTEDHLSYLKDRLQEGRSPATVNAYIGVLRSLEIAASKNRIEFACAWAYRNLARVPCSAELAGRELSHAETQKLLAACAANPSREVALRDRFLFLFMWATGLRRGALAALQMSDLDRPARQVKIKTATEAAKHSKAKNNKQQAIPYDEALAEEMDAYLALRGEWEGVLFVRSTPGRPPHTLTRRPLGYAGVGWVVKQRYTAAGLDHITPHDFRRTAITQWIDHGGERAAQLLAGHENIQTTMRYDRAGHRRMQSTVHARGLPVAVVGDNELGAT